MSRIPLTEQLSKLAEELKCEGDAESLAGKLVRLGAKRLIQELLEAEVTEYLGRERYERSDGEEGRRGYRNGHKARRLDSAEGRLHIDVPQVSDSDEPFRSKLWRAMKRRTEALEHLAVEMYVRGLSTRDIEDALCELGDGRPLLSRSTVSRLTEELWAEYEAFSGRDLSGFDVVYLFCDAVYESLRRQAGLGEGILVTWAILSDGSKVLIHMGLGNKESYEDWLEHFRDVTRRGLKIPLTVTTDGAPGLIKAVEAMWPEAERIRCWVHKMRNVLDKVPEEARAVLKPYLEAVRDAPDYETGKAMARVVIERFRDEYPSAMRSFEEERRRAKVLPRFRTEKECLKLVYATLWRASERWRRVRFTEHERRQLERYVQQRRIQRGREEGEATSTVA